MNQLSDYHRDRVQAVLDASPLVPVIAIQNAEDALPLCRALVDGGIRVLEITLRTEHGVRAIEQIRKAIPEAWVGAGTVTSIAQYRQVESAGAQFVITPGVRSEEHTSELQSRPHLVCRLLLEKKKK